MKIEQSEKDSTRHSTTKETSKMKKYMWLLLTICLVQGYIMGMILGFDWLHADSLRKDFGYAGTISLQEDEYLNFKQLIVVEDTEVEIVYICVLNLNYPVLISFEVSVPHDYIFPYGERKDIYESPEGSVAFLALFGILGGAISLALIFRIVDEWLG